MQPDYTYVVRVAYNGCHDSRKSIRHISFRVLYLPENPFSPSQVLNAFFKKKNTFGNPYFLGGFVSLLADLCTFLNDVWSYLLA